MSKIYKKPPHCKGLGDHQTYLSRITKTLYYGRLPKTDVLSLPVTELAAEIFSETRKGKSLDRLHLDTAAQISRNACVSPCSLVLALLYFERLKKCNIEYLEKIGCSDLFLVSLMVSSKFLFDDGQVDEVFMDEWAASGGLTCKELVQLERDFLQAIDWKIYANELTFWKKLYEIETKLAMNQGKMRGHFTYTELALLGDTMAKDFQEVVQSIAAFSVFLAGVYMAALLVLAGSVALTSTIPGTTLYLSRHVDPKTTFAITQGPLVSENCSSTPSEATFNSTKYFTSKYNAIKVFKAGIFLASLTADNRTERSGNGTNKAVIDEKKGSNNRRQYVSWDWWNVPVMNWLTAISDYAESFEMPAIENCLYFLQNKVANDRMVDLGDHIHKATKTRLQDQLERNWHVEWTATIQARFQPSIHDILPYYFQSIKS